MYPYDLPIEYRVIIGISAMVLLFSGFLISFVTSQRKKLHYHREIQRLNEQQKAILIEQNQQLEQRVRERTTEINQQKEALQTSLVNLKATQAQLVQKEKMASLGELTAGIAHEIQNPLNFVNNFSEVSAELLDELKEGAQAGRTADVLAIADDLSDNLKRITQNGRRASNIVKGMLEHSRSSSGEKQPTDLNTLAEEYLQRAYQGFIQSAGRTPGAPGKQKNSLASQFTCRLETHLATDLRLVDVVPQDISRVLLNLFNNAFYAVGEQHRKQPEGYEPTVSLTTKRINDRVEICVGDNGAGIPVSIREKIFQPFFTTKPTGEGTGLGLSLSYDIVTKGHQGSLRVVTEDGQGAQFVIQLPTAIVDFK